MNVALTHNKAYKLHLSLEAFVKEVKDISCSAVMLCNASPLLLQHSPLPNPQVMKFTGGTKPEGIQQKSCYSCGG